jgi:hypothetical protein
MQGSIEAAARWEWMCDILEGKPVSDFAMSYPEIRKLHDLVSETAHKISRHYSFKEDHGVPVCFYKCKCGWESDKLAAYNVHTPTMLERAFFGHLEKAWNIR